jgi:hypothetical protein
LPYKILRRYLSLYSSIKPVLRELRKLIESTWKFHFLGNIKQDLFNITKCKFASEDAKPKNNFYLNISKKCPVDCNICEFWKSREQDLQTLRESKLDAVNDPKGKLKKIQNVADEIAKGASPHSDNCKSISDAVISLEARDSKQGIIIHSMDADFNLLGQIFKIHVRRLDKNKLRTEKSD